MTIFFKVLIGLGVLVFTCYEGYGLYKDLKKRKIKRKVIDSKKDNTAAVETVASIKSDKEV